MNLVETNPFNSWGEDLAINETEETMGLRIIRYTAERLQLGDRKLYEATYVHVNLISHNNSKPIRSVWTEAIAYIGLSTDGLGRLNAHLRLPARCQTSTRTINGGRTVAPL